MRALSASGENAFISIEAAMMYMNLDLPDEASRVLSLIKGSPGRELGQTQIYAARGDWAGMLTFGKAMQAKSNEPFWPTVVFQGEAMTGHPVEALRALRGLRPDLFTAQPSVAVTDLGTPLAAAHLMRATGATAQGDLLLARIMAVTAPIADLRSPNDWRVARLRVFAERGQTAEGLAELEGLVRAGWRSPYLFDDSTPIEQSPTIGRLKDEPRFKALLAEVRQDLAQQRAAVLAARQKGAG
jgi:hypothetical protein